jgi:hypothetical protein
VICQVDQKITAGEDFNQLPLKEFTTIRNPKQGEKVEINNVLR